MNNTTIPPAHVVVRAFGGVRAAARLLHMDASAVSRWQLSGRIPSPHQRRILEIAWKNGIDLTAHDIVFGRQS